MFSIRLLTSNFLPLSPSKSSWHLLLLFLLYTLSTSYYCCLSPTPVLYTLLISMRLLTSIFSPSSSLRFWHLYLPFLLITYCLLAYFLYYFLSYLPTYFLLLSICLLTTYFLLLPFCSILTPPSPLLASPLTKRTRRWTSWVWGDGAWAGVMECLKGRGGVVLTRREEMQGWI